MDDLEVGFIGLGLIGGSLAKTIRKFYPSCTILAFDCDETAIDLAVAEGTIDHICRQIDSSFSNCDYLFLCAPVAYNIINLDKMKAILKKDCILSDVGSVKTAIHEKIIELGLESYFIGGHPMAGSEKTGYSYASAHMFENAYYILTPSASVAEEKVQQYEAFVQSLVAIPLVLDYKEHDYIVAAISHLPHIIASGLVNLIRSKDSKETYMKTLAAGGFKDITRIASSSPRMWQQICQMNGVNLTAIINDYIETLREMQTMLVENKEEDIYHFFDSAKKYRNSLPNNSLGPIQKAYEIYCDIPNIPGVLAKIATILAQNDINLKSIETVRNREFEEAILHIGFYTKQDFDKAIHLLRDKKFTVYER